MLEIMFCPFPDRSLLSGGWVGVVGGIENKANSVSISIEIAYWNWAWQNCRWKQWPASLSSATTGGTCKPPGPTTQQINWSAIHINSQSPMINRSIHIYVLSQQSTNGPHHRTDYKTTGCIFPISISYHSSTVNCCHEPDLAWQPLPVSWLSVSSAIKGE